MSALAHTWDRLTLPGRALLTSEGFGVRLSSTVLELTADRIMKTLLPMIG